MFSVTKRSSWVFKRILSTENGGENRCCSRLEAVLVILIPHRTLEIGVKGLESLATNYSTAQLLTPKAL